MLPRRSSSVCSFTALLRRRNFPHGKSDRHKSMSSSRGRTRSRTVPLQKILHGKGREWRQSRLGRNRRRSASRGVRWRVPTCCEKLGPEAHMIELGLLRTKTSFDIAEAFAINELSKGQTEELIPAGKIFDVAIALVPIDANFETGRWGGIPRVVRKRFGLG